MKKILTILFTLWICSVCTICAFADAVLKGKTFDAYTDFSAGAPSTSAPEGYVYAGYRVEQINNLYSTVTNLFVLETETPMVLHYTQGNSGYTISIPGGTYYKNYITYDKNGERNKNETPTKQNATSFSVGTNMCFYPALKMINSATGEELDPNGDGVFTLHAFLDSNAVYHFSVSCDDPGYDYFNAKVHFYHINGSFSPPLSATYTDSGDYSKPVSYSSVATSETDFAYYDQYFNKFSRTNLQPFLSGVDGDGSQGFIYTQHDLTSGSSAPSSFDPELYEPYASRGAFGFDTLYGIGITSDVTYNIKSLSMYDGKSWYPTSDNFGLVAVVKQEGKADIVLYYKFSRSAVLVSQGKWIVAPINAPTIEEPEEPVSDLQQLAEYLKYLASVNTVNNTTIYNNYMSELNDMPWNDYIYGGLKLWMPELSNEFSNMRFFRFMSSHKATSFLYT